MIQGGYHESRRCSRDTYPESYISKYILIYEDYPRETRNRSVDTAQIEGWITREDMAEPFLMLGTPVNTLVQEEHTC